jgi:hypothetical protein
MVTILGLLVQQGLQALRKRQQFVADPDLRHEWIPCGVLFLVVLAGPRSEPSCSTSLARFVRADFLRITGFAPCHHQDIETLLNSAPRFASLHFPY